MLNEIPSEETATFESIDCVPVTIIQEEFLNTIVLSSLQPHILKLKKHAVVILLQNMDKSNYHCNGSRYVMKYISKHIIGTTNSQTNKQILIPRIPLFNKQSYYLFVMRRLHFPMHLFYASTFNQVQGQSVQK